ncbi:FAD:protein FMN transferase [Parabacteroides bouchesdurhonensis]|uniref:FAD:protein FMN transferase n=1 Tax=Parabacteroides bouchesdurhonensis TaxID=1936995 RepID=UPI000C81DDE5|nr:FAD:protein FMN transferase [Parabacteroides bouchesdurhonensis]
MKQTTAILVFLSACMLFSSCQQKQQYYTLTGQLHTPYVVKYEYKRPLTNEINAEFQHFYHLFNAFDSTSVISRINRNEDLSVKDTLFAKLFNTAKHVSEQTDGAYDITSAPIINLWGFGFSKKDSVTPGHIDSVKAFVGYQKIHLVDGEIKKNDPRLQLNASSLADGTVCDMIARMFEEKGIQNFMIDFGGEVVAKGVNPKGECWRIGITKPIDDASGATQDIQEIVTLCGRHALATSGNYRNFYIKDGKKYAHTVDPREGCPVQRDVLGATVIAPEGMVADAYATACMVLGSEGARKLKELAPEIEYYLICSDSTSTNYRIEYSEGFGKYLPAKE